MDQVAHPPEPHNPATAVPASRPARPSLRGLAGPRAEKGVSLALQGGGSHGAFTWGVLDALIEDGRLGFEAVTGASAGAMNGVVLVDGWLAGGPDGARAALEAFWRRASLDGELRPPSAASSTAGSGCSPRNPVLRLLGQGAVAARPMP